MGVLQAAPISPRNVRSAGAITAAAIGCFFQPWKVSLRSSQPTYAIEYPENGNALRVIIQQAKAAHHQDEVAQTRGEGN
jgi:hypothetical protein